MHRTGRSAATDRRSVLPKQKGGYAVSAGSTGVLLCRCTTPVSDIARSKQTVFGSLPPRIEAAPRRPTPANARSLSSNRHSRRLSYDQLYPLSPAPASPDRPPSGSRQGASAASDRRLRAPLRRTFHSQSGSANRPLSSPALAGAGQKPPHQTDQENRSVF